METKSSFNINAPNFKLNKNYKSNNINDNMKTNETKKKASNYKKKSRNDDVNNNNNNNNNHIHILQTSSCVQKVVLYLR